jgi:hypothetical protein
MESSVRVFVMNVAHQVSGNFVGRVANQVALKTIANLVS